MKELPYEQLLVSSLNNKDKMLNVESFTYKSLFLSSIVPDDTNARFFPAIFIGDEHAKLFVNRKISKKQLNKLYHAEDHVMIGKSCIINSTKYDSQDWKKANETIESIIELGDNIAVSELIQTPTLYPIENSKYRVLTGHRRFFALVYANGYDSAAQFKLYDSKPLLIKIKQFQENASRRDLPQYGKLVAFGNAISEIEILNTARVRVGLKKLTIKETAINLGISMGAFDNFNVLTRYPCVINAYESGLSYSFIKSKKIVLNSESKYKTQYQKTVLNVTDRKNINDEIKAQLTNSNYPHTLTKTFKFGSIKSLKTIKSLLTTDIRSLDLGIVWDDVDWEDYLTVSTVMATVVDYLEHRD